jgi:hypothetical protein
MQFLIMNRNINFVTVYLSEMVCNDVLFQAFTKDFRKGGD